MPSSPAASFSCSCLRELGQPVDRGDHLRRRRGRGGVPLPPQDRLKRAAVPPPVRRHRVAVRVRRGERQRRAGALAGVAAALACAFWRPGRCGRGRPGRAACRPGPPGRPAAWPPAGRRRPGTRAAAAPGRAALCAAGPRPHRLRARGRVQRGGAEGASLIRARPPLPPPLAGGRSSSAAAAWPHRRPRRPRCAARALGAARPRRRQPGRRLQGRRLAPGAAGRAPRRPRPRGRGPGRRRRYGDACRWLPLRWPGSPVTCHRVALRTETPADESAEPLE